MAELTSNIAATLARGRCAAEARMVDSCTIRRGATPRTFNRTTGLYTAGTGTTIYDGCCEVQIGGTSDALTPETGGGEATVQQLVVKVPVTAEPYQIGDVVTLNTSVHDPSLADREYRVTALHGKTYATARRLQCNEITGA